MTGYRRIACAWAADRFHRLSEASIGVPKFFARVGDWFEARA
ncbi:hypothetical protein [Methylobacterium sp. C25]|nr:hypothetical protein [Methylobacterium sp. C25]